MAGLEFARETTNTVVITMAAVTEGLLQRAATAIILQEERRLQLLENGSSSGESTVPCDKGHKTEDRFEITITPHLQRTSAKIQKQAIEFTIPANNAGHVEGDVPRFASRVFGPNVRDSILEYRKLLRLNTASCTSFSLPYYNDSVILNVTAYDNPDDSISMVGSLRLLDWRMAAWRVDIHPADF